ncbi:thioredoxin reductase [Leptothrix ochracea L12]|uniref:Ferredoxin--NADP reductase n=1 Tax=Leptothrix ochracea L12 TaxID=735332 RepID=I4Z5E4_9BURK|nr:thioredoxin reductase [Leptothrix ochracea L12]
MDSARSIIETDAVIIGAGPVGLFQAFELGLLGIKAHVLDALEQPGGQCLELYPNKPIYDIPGIPSCTGRELVASLLEQIRPFQTPFHLGETVVSVEQKTDGQFLVETRRGTQFLSRTLFVAAGVGAFEPRKIPLEELLPYTGSQLFYQVPPEDGSCFANKHLVIVGGDDEALDCVFRFAQEGPEQAASVTLIHRRTDIATTPANLERLHALCAKQQVRFIAGQITGLVQDEHELQALIVSRVADNLDEHLPTDALLVRLGRSPKLGPIAQWGIALERKQIVVNTEHFESSTAGLFAIGDINTYPGKKKLILCGFHEATLAAFAAMRYIYPSQAPSPLLYTTSSPQLHNRLGVTSTD